VDRAAGAASDRAGGRLSGERSTGRASTVRPSGGPGEAAGRGASPAPGEKVRTGAAGGASDAIRPQPGAPDGAGHLGHARGVLDPARRDPGARGVRARAHGWRLPLRNYLTQRQELSALQAKQHQLAGEVDDLTRRRDQLSDPVAVQAEARDRLGLRAPRRGAVRGAAAPADTAAVGRRRGVVRRGRRGSTCCGAMCEEYSGEWHSGGRGHPGRPGRGGRPAGPPPPGGARGGAPLPVRPAVRRADQPAPGGRHPVPDDVLPDVLPAVLAGRHARGWAAGCGR